jgi:hypothetical protein
LGTISILASPDDFGFNGVVVLLLWVVLLVGWVVGIGAFILGAVLWRAWLRRRSPSPLSTERASSMSAALPRARHQLAQGEYKKAADALWQVERDARSDLADANELVDLARTLRDATSGRLKEQANNLLGYGQQHVNRLSRQVEGTTQTGDDVSASGRPQGSSARRRAVAFGTAVVGTFVGIVGGLAAALVFGFVGDLVDPPSPASLGEFNGGALFLYLVIGLLIGGYVGVRVASAYRRRLANR